MAVLGAIYLSVIAWFTYGRAGRDSTALADMPLVVRGIGKSLTGRRVVHDVSFDVRPGEILGLLGPNGAGKTTLLRLITGLAEPDCGSAALFGQNVKAGAAALSHVGVCIEAPGVQPHLTGWESLRSLWSVTGRPESESCIEIVAELSGLGEALRRRVSGYSLGMRHRLGLAQAMLGLPRLLILDEPTHGLDPGQIRFLRNVLQSYAASGRAVLMASHHLEEVEQMCTGVVLLNRGSVVHRGSVVELRASGIRLADMYFEAVGDE
ncbi:ATP-binding cassette domain-containing protein [Skermania sp. ID1734]|uniref:ABC transporter ATP-binding protein n=1 Tax=Skermania sp. ID1734 TaxID=2597516 RepID=UPI0011811C50|nr:ATP-binding cassette domain-containing protein [Skermania sp. ID1734]TSD96642.1 ATP-binding cassette domain-containing protein [Skermania sp. ID1734]